VFGQADLEGAEAHGLADPEPDGEARLLASEDHRLLERALAKLPPGLKEPLILTAFEELSQQQAGELLGLTAKAVEVRVYRARRKLAELLGADPSAKEGEG
jgi:RNA polymerase sigma-70 factor (ECF subfamily)